MTKTPGRVLAGWLTGAALAGGAAAATYVGLVTAAVPIDLGIGRRTQPLGPITMTVRASRATVFDVIAQPYLGRTSRAMRDKVQVLEASSDMVLAAHRTPIRGPLVATTVETVRFTRPHRVDFRLVRGPVPYVVEEFVLNELAGGTEVIYRGELGTDLGLLGQRWGAVVAARWSAAVADSFDTIKMEAERRTGGKWS